MSNPHLVQGGRSGISTAERRPTSEIKLGNGRCAKTSPPSQSGRPWIKQGAEGPDSDGSTKMYVNGDAYFSMTALPAVDRANLSTMTRKERVEPLWSGMRGQRPPPPVGCRTFLMVSFSSMVFLENLAHDKGAQEASRTSRPMRQEARTETAQRSGWRRTLLGPSSTDFQLRPASLEHWTKRGTLRAA